ncbi:MAG: N-acetylglucosaminyldiphosphoundecaprenol N-acetyl-beta-D-mannosaminyltransferase [Patescibacteria group bacterium]|nr:N-acetylglucosaminyldiphosphoundecaprenol N-acetyl-beta-D-mannosaminyltransferase [Patescibacteria group bacterium]
MDISKEYCRENVENILGVRIDNLSEDDILLRLEGFLAESKFHQIATVNPEFILEAQKNPEFKKILNNCDLNVADGFGIKCAFWRYGKNLKCRMTGADLMLELLRLAEKNNLKVFLAARADGLSTWQETKEAILKVCPNLQIDGADIECHSHAAPAGRQVGGNPVSGLAVSALDSRLRGNDKYILFVNFGAPSPELFINSVKNDSIRLAMGVGGSFDFLTGKVWRAPNFMRSLGLEWLWRLIQPQPWKFKKERLKRIFRAVVIFPVKVILNRN